MKESSHEDLEAEFIFHSSDSEVERLSSKGGGEKNRAVLDSGATQPMSGVEERFEQERHSRKSQSKDLTE